MPKQRKPRASKRAKSHRLTKAQERELLLQTLLEAGDYEAAVDVAQPHPRPSRAKPAQRRAIQRPTAKPRKVAPAPKLTAAEKNAARLRHDRAQRAAETRKQPHKRITSRTRRVTRASVKYREVAFEASDIISGRREEKPQVRVKVDARFSGYIGRDVQISLGFVVILDGDQSHFTRIRRIIRNFQGRADIAAMINSAAREAMRQLGSSAEVYLTSISLQEIEA